MPLLVHGIVRALPPPGLDGLEGGSVTTATEGALQAVVSETEQEEPLPSRAALLHHTRVLEGLSERTTVLPMRFGVVVPDEATLIAEFLVPEQQRLLAALDRLEGHVELRLRGRYLEPAIIREVLDSDPRAARLRGRRGTDAKLELGERIVQGIERHRADHLQRVLDATRDHVAGVSPGSVAEPLDAFVLSFLVGDEDREGFEAAVDQLGDTLAPVVRLELVGPVPPFSFASTEESSWV